MRASLDPSSLSLRLAFDDKSALLDFLDAVRRESGFQIALERGLKQYDVVSVAVGWQAATSPAFKAYAARIEEVEPGVWQTALVVQDWSAPDEVIVDSLKKSVHEESGGEREGDSPVGETRGMAAVHIVKKLNPSQKAVLAQRASRAERQVLLRDSSPQVLQGLLVNPRLEAKEVLRIAKSTYATAAILQRLAGDARWGKNHEILAAIVRNPHSPTPIVTRLVDKLRTSDLRQMAKMSSGLKEAVRKAALREYTRRSSH